MTSISIASDDDVPRLFDIWEASVQATHDFLHPDDFLVLVPVVERTLREFTPLHCVRDAAGQACAFMGVSEGMIEMLFVDPPYRGQGAGRALVEFAIAQLGATQVDVNEQNRQALGFYERMGFVVQKRSEQDPYGKPYPILHLALTAPLRSSRSAADPQA